jgi:hypothetical protein
MYTKQQLTVDHVCILSIYKLHNYKQLMRIEYKAIAKLIIRPIHRSDKSMWH